MEETAQEKWWNGIRYWGIAIFLLGLFLMIMLGDYKKVLFPLGLIIGGFNFIKIAETGKLREKIKLLENRLGVDSTKDSV